jgi:hypothetical protein
MIYRLHSVALPPELPYGNSSFTHPAPYEVMSERLIFPSGAARRLLNRPILSENGDLIGLMNMEENGQLLVGRWLCHCTPEAVVAGMKTALELLALHPCRAVLSDGSAASGDWSDLVPWMQYDLLPRALAAGVRLIANVRSPDPASRLAHQDYARHAAQYVQIKLFDDAGLARRWLREQLAASA